MDELSAPELVRIPVEIPAEAVVFKVVTRGYDPRQVDAHVAALEQDLAELRWEQEDFAAQKQALEVQREEQARWTPSFSALGDRVAEIIHVAEDEAGALRSTAAREVARSREQIAAEVAAHQQELDRARQVAERDLRVLEFTARSRRELLETELAQAQRDAEVRVASQIAQAQAHAQQVREQAARDAAAELAAARVQVADLRRQRDELAIELVDLSDRLVAVIGGIAVPAGRVES